MGTVLNQTAAVTSHSAGRRGLIQPNKESPPHRTISQPKPGDPTLTAALYQPRFPIAKALPHR